MNYFSDLQFSQVILSILVSAGIIGGILYGVFRKTYCQGKDRGESDTNHNNEIENLKNKYNDLEEKYNLLTLDIQTYRTKTEEKLDEITSNQTELKSDLADIKGYLEGKFGKANGP